MNVRSVVLLSFGFALLLVGKAKADTETAEPLRLDYAAPAECPARDVFFGEVLGRTRRARAALGTERARLLRVRIERRGSTFTGALSIEDDGVRSSPRDVSASTCGEVTSALGIVAALAVDPRASVAVAPPPSTNSGGPTATSEGPRSPPATAPPPTPPPDETPAARGAATGESTTPSTPPAAPSTSPSGSPRFGVGAQAEVSTIADSVAAGRLFFDLNPSTRSKGWAPTFRLAASRSFDVERSLPVGSARFVWTVAALEVCPLVLPIATTVTVRPCAGVGVGVVDAAPRGIAAPANRSRPWGAAGTHARLVWGPVRSFAVELEAGLLAPFLRESFFFEPDGTTLYRAPPLAFVTRVGGAYRFP